jgi:solute carrier family 35 (UDP-galactose transporter), member B1
MMKRRMNITVVDEEREKQNGGDDVQKGRVQHSESQAHQTLIFLAEVLGIYACYLFYSYFQEKLMTREYGDHGAKFELTTVLLAVACFLNASCALAVRRYTFGSEQRNVSIDALKFAPVSLSYILAMFFSNSAVRYISYPAQVLGKSCKPVFVIVMHFFVLKKRYSMAKYLIVLLVASGIVLFVYNPNKAATKAAADVGEDDALYEWLGVGLIVASLFCDGLTGSLQDKLVKSMPSNAKMHFSDTMLLFNAWAFVYLLAIAVALGELPAAFEFLGTYPSAWVDILLFSVCSALGQLFIHRVVHSHDSLVVSMVTTTRKFFTILASVLLFGHTLSTVQWAGVFIVFCGLAADAFISKRNKTAQFRPSVSTPFVSGDQEKHRLRLDAKQ